ncbi:MAG TPA: glycosyl hydrolase family 65 protein [Pelomicrobium sp.]|nr:glycosyl hydrolase family 65 protein [Pelomicrobium sp.]
MSDWTLDYDEYVPEQEGLREALCTLGNGYFATRGASSQARADGIHYPGTYLAGGYNRLTSHVAGRDVVNEDLVNFPNWLPLMLRIGDADWLDLRNVEILAYHQSLDIRHGILTRSVRFRDAAGHTSKVDERRLVHMRHMHFAAIELTITAEDWSGPLTVMSALDGRVVNDGVERYRGLANRHLEPLEQDAAPDVLSLKVRTVQSRLEVALAARTQVLKGAAPVETAPRPLSEPGYAAHEYSLRLEAGESVRVEKVVALFTSRDRAVSECALAARKSAANAPPLESLFAEQKLVWEQLWRRFDIEVEEADEGGERTERILRLHIFHLLQTASPNTIDLDAGVPARGWHGEAYRGHIFWDELFIFPLLNLRLPQITRALLLYRYRRLDAARSNARHAGFRGAMYPWQSGSSGREESQVLHLNPKSGRWVPDPSHLQRHINVAIAYNVWQYWHATGDDDFMLFYGAEMFLEIARFWAGAATFSDEKGRYEIRHVMGPDEFQTAYPDAEENGIHNNSYTNVMAVWVLCRALDLLESLPQARGRELRELLRIEDDELARWEDVSRRMFVPFHGEGIISQFEGYEKLEEFDWAGYRKKYGDIHRLDRILEKEGDTPNRYKAQKQADVMMLFYILSAEQLGDLFRRLGYPWEYETIPRNVEYYTKRTSHGSTLSRVVASWVLARSDRAGSWDLFNQALESDVADIQGGTTPEGIHLGAMAGVVDILQRAYTGIVVREQVLWLNPCLPEDLQRLFMVVRFRGHLLDVEIRSGKVTLRAHESKLPPVKVGVIEDVYEIAPGETREVAFEPPQ